MLFPWRWKHFWWTINLTIVLTDSDFTLQYVITTVAILGGGGLPEETIFGQEGVAEEWDPTLQNEHAM